MLAERPAFATFPRLKLAAGEEFQGFERLASLIVKRAKLDAQVVALPDKAGISFQFSQTFFRFFTEPLPNLVALVKQSRVRTVGDERLFVSGARFCRLSANVEIADAEISP